MTKSNTTVDAAADALRTAAIAIMPEQQAADAWTLSFADIADQAALPLAAVQAMKHRYHRALHLLRDHAGSLTLGEHEQCMTVAMQYQTQGVALVDGCLRATQAAALAGGVYATWSAATFASAFMVSLTGAPIVGTITAVAVAAAALFGALKFGDILRDFVTMLGDLVSTAVYVAKELLAVLWSELRDLFASLRN